MVLMFGDFDSVRSAVVLFRAVVQAELEQIRRTRTLKNPQGFEVKYFATSEAGAARYARLAYGQFGDESPYYIIRVEVTSALCEGSHQIGEGKIVEIFLNACKQT